MDTLDRLIEILCKERGEKVPFLDNKQKENFFRCLCNIREPKPISDEFILLQNKYLSNKNKIINNINNLNYENQIALFKGDITTLNVDVIVNAANSQMLGCFHPLHNCIDNIIHSKAGVQLRLECNDIMKGNTAKNGEVIVTKGYNLPCTYVFHTVGPIVNDKVTKDNIKDLEKCYLNCLKKADELNLNTIAFCCISTGVFGYPKEDAAKLAVRLVQKYLKETKSNLKVIFDVFTEEDYEIYSNILK